MNIAKILEKTYWENTAHHEEMTEKEKATKFVLTKVIPFVFKEAEETLDIVIDRPKNITPTAVCEVLAEFGLRGFVVHNTIEIIF